MSDLTSDHNSPAEPQADGLPGDDFDLDEDYDEYDTEEGEEDAGPPGPVNWYLLRADVLEK